MRSQFCASKTLSRTQKSPWIEHPAGLCFGAITRLQVRKRRRLGALAQENVVFGPTVLAHGAFKKPGNPLELPGLQPVEKPAPAIKPEQVFCLETKAETEKASKQQLHFSPILFVFRHPAPDGGHSISKWPAFSDSWQQI